MAKAKARKSKTKGFSKSTKRSLLIVGVALLFVGFLIFLLEQKKQSTVNQAVPEVAQASKNNPVSPGSGCSEADTNYVCDIKINNPSDKTLEWSSIINGIEGGTVSNDGYGSIEPNSSAMIQLTVPKAFCETNPSGKGSVTILEDKKSSNQGETVFTCQQNSQKSENSPTGN